MRIKFLRAQNVRAENMRKKEGWVNMWVPSVTLKNYESKKYYFKKSERKKGNS